jgi:hypothetical protein
MKTESVMINKGLVFDGLLFATYNDRGRYIGTLIRNRPQWLKDNPDKWWSVADIQEQAVQPRPPVENENNVGAAPAGRNGQTSSHDVREDGGEERDVTLVDTPAGDCSLPYQPTSLPVPVPAIIKGTTKAELLPPTKAATSEVEGAKMEETTPFGAMGAKRGRGGGRQIKKQKLPAEASKAGRKLSPERMRVVLECLREYPVLSDAASKAGIHRKTLEYWIKCSEAGNDGYDIEWQGEIWRFHEHCQTAIEEPHDRILDAAWNIAMGRVIYKTDPFLVDLGCQGPDAYLKNENGNFIPEAFCAPNPKMIRFLLAWKRPEKWGKHRNIDVPQKCGVVIIGDVTKKPENSSAASIKARQWKSRSRRIREAKP